jgi:hypothetical protein
VNDTVRQPACNNGGRQVLLNTGVMARQKFGRAGRFCWHREVDWSAMEARGSDKSPFGTVGPFCSFYAKRNCPTHPGRRRKLIEPAKVGLWCRPRAGPSICFKIKGTSKN